MNVDTKDTGPGNAQGGWAGEEDDTHCHHLHPRGPQEEICHHHQDPEHHHQEITTMNDHHQEVMMITLEGMIMSAPHQGAMIVMIGHLHLPEDQSTHHHTEWEVEALHRGVTTHHRDPQILMQEIHTLEIHTQGIHITAENILEVIHIHETHMQDLQIHMQVIGSHQIAIHPHIAHHKVKGTATLLHQDLALGGTSYEETANGASVTTRDEKISLQHADCLTFCRRYHLADASFSAQKGPSQTDIVLIDYYFIS